MSGFSALRTRVEIRQPEMSAGAPVWTSAGLIWARLVSRQGAEAGDGAATPGRERRTYEIRAWAGAQPGWRLIDAGRTFAIRSIAAPGAPGAPLTLACEEEFA